MFFLTELLWVLCSMVREIVRNESFLSLPSLNCDFPCFSLYSDLKDTLESKKDFCIGIAANMIGERKRAMAVIIEGRVKVMFNPVILSGSGEYEAEEGCLSLEGKRKARRYETIELLYSDYKGREKVSLFSSVEAEAIQHEMDHMDGILI